jgi:hypothetical protein
MRRDQHHELYRLEKGWDVAIQGDTMNDDMTVSLIEDWDGKQNLLFCEVCCESEVSQLIDGDMQGKLLDMYEVRHSEDDYETICEDCLESVLAESLVLPGLDEATR